MSGNLQRGSLPGRCPHTLGRARHHPVLCAEAASHRSRLSGRAEMDRGLDLASITYLVGRESVRVTDLPGMASWREHLYCADVTERDGPSLLLPAPREPGLRVGASSSSSDTGAGRTVSAWVASWTSPLRRSPTPCRLRLGPYRAPPRRHQAAACIHAALPPEGPGGTGPRRHRSTEPNRACREGRPQTQEAPSSPTI
jgi:hypothetical protein